MARRSKTSAAPKPAAVQTGTVYPTGTAIDMEPPPRITWAGPATFNRYNRARSWTVMAGGERGHFLAPTGVWLATGTRTDDPYPCSCKNLEERGRCRDLDNHDLVIERGWRPCPCWGQPVEPGIPGGCCRNHPASRRLHEPAERAPEPVLTIETETRLRRDTADGELQRIDVETVYAEVLDPEAATPTGASGLDLHTIDVVKGRIKDCTCTCRTPWDGDKRTTGHHCPDCHRNFASNAAAEAHSADWRKPCRDPRTIAYDLTGQPLLYRRLVDGFEVWAYAGLSEVRTPRFKYE